jgi:2-hydroxy-3-keto-5-methylthiopentenyl-1-phosphate phosphatase
MKITELLENKQEKMPHLYLDMDGVQADFFGAWADRLGVDHWKAITDKEKEINILANSTAEDVYDFFRNLKPLKSGKEVVAWIKKNNIPFTVLSAPLRGPFADASKQAKKDWLDQYNPGTSSNAIFTSRKQQYAVTNGVRNVLVDDFGPYIQKWTDAGGIPVKHAEEFEDPNTAQNTISLLEKIYSPYLDK